MTTDPGMETLHTILFLWSWGWGMLGILLWFIATFIDPDDPRVRGFPPAILKRHGASLPLAIVSHTIMTVGLFSYGVRHPLAYVASGAFSQLVIVKMLSIVLGILTGKLFGFKPAVLQKDADDKGDQP